MGQLENHSATDWLYAHVLQLRGLRASQQHVVVADSSITVPRSAVAHNLPVSLHGDTGGAALTVDMPAQQQYSSSIQV